MGTRNLAWISMASLQHVYTSGLTSSDLRFCWLSYYQAYLVLWPVHSTSFMSVNWIHKYKQLRRSNLVRWQWLLVTVSPLTFYSFRSWKITYVFEIIFVPSECTSSSSVIRSPTWHSERSLFFICSFFESIYSPALMEASAFISIAKLKMHSQSKNQCELLLTPHSPESFLGLHKLPQCYLFSVAFRTSQLYCVCYILNLWM